MKAELGKNGDTVILSPVTEDDRSFCRIALSHGVELVAWDDGRCPPGIELVIGIGARFEQPVASRNLG